MHNMGTIRLVSPTPSETTRGTSFINKDSSLMNFSSSFDRDWLLGFLEADGTFSCTRSLRTGKIQLAIKLTQHQKNIRALVAVKKLLHTGKLEDTKNNTVVYRIRKHHVLRTHVFPFLHAAPFVTSKYYDYLRLQHYVTDKEFFPWQNHPSRLAPRWGEVLGTQKLTRFLDTYELEKKDARKLLTPGWLTGFLEGDGSFYIVKKGDGRYSCGFGVTQKHGKYVLEAIRRYFQIRAKVKKHSSYPHVWCLDTTSTAQAQVLAKYFEKHFKGVMSLRFRLWKRALHFLDQPEKMKKIQGILRKIGEKK